MLKKFFCWMALITAFCSWGYANKGFFIPERSDEAELLLQKVHSLCEQEQWREAVSLCEEIIAKYGKKLVKNEKDSFLYVSAYQVCLEKMQKMPSNIMEEYCQTIDLKARRLLREREDVEQWKRVSYEYVFSDSGAHSLTRLVDWHLMREQYNQSIPYILKFLRYARVENEKKLAMIARLALCYFSLGDERELRKLYKHAKKHHYRDKIYVDGRKRSLAKYVASLGSQMKRRLFDLNASVEWPFIGKEPQHTFAIEQVVSPQGPSWTQNIEKPKRKPKRRQFYNEPIRRNIDGPPCYYPIIAENTLFINNGKDIHAYDLLSGKQKWHFQGLVSRLQSTHHEQVIHSVSYHQGALYANVEGKTPTQSNEQWSVYEIRKILAERRLIKLDAKTGRLLWQVHNPQEGEEAFENKASFMAPPIVWGDYVYVGATELTGFFNAYIVAIDRKTGKLAWKKLIGSAQQEQNLFGRPVREVASSMVSISNGKAFYLTNLGAVGCVDLDSGQLLWVRIYPRTPIPTPRRALFATQYRDPAWNNSPLIVAEDSVYIAPIDSQELYCIDAINGKLRWMAPRRSWEGHSRFDGSYLLTVSHGKVALGGNGVKLLEASTGKKLQILNIGQVTGYGYVSGTQLYCPTKSSLSIIDLQKNTIAQTIPWRNHRGIGHIVATDMAFVATDMTSISVYTNLAAIEQFYKGEIRKHPDHPLFYLRLADIYTQKSNANLKKSEKLYAKAISLSKSNQKINGAYYNSWGRSGLLQIYLELAKERETSGQLDKANEYYEKALRLTDDSELVIPLLFRLYHYYKQDGNSEQLLLCLHRLLHEYPEEMYFSRELGALVNVSLYVSILLAEYYETKGELEKAIVQYQSILLKYPRKMHLKENGWDLAFSRIAGLIRKFGQKIYHSYDKEVENSYTVIREQQNFDEENELLNLFERYPNSHLIPAIAMRITDILISKQQHQKAGEFLRLYVQRYPQAENLVQAYYLLVECYEKTNIPTAARTILRLLGKEHSTEKIQTPSGEIVVIDYVAKKLQQDIYYNTIERPTPVLDLWQKDRPKKHIFEKSDQYFLRLVPMTGNPPAQYEHLIFLHLQESLLCYDGRDGTRIWEKKLGWVRSVGFLQERLIAWDTQNIYCLQPNSGKTLWTKQVENRFAELQVGAGAIGIISHDKQDQSAQATVVVREPDTGEVRWKSHFASEEPPELLIAEEVIVAHSTFPPQVRVYDTDSGRLLYTFAKRTIRKEEFYSPIIIGGKYLCLVEENRQVKCYQIPSMEKMWSYDAKEITPHTLLGNEQYVCFMQENNLLVMLDLHSGGLKWTWQLPKKAKLYKSFADWDTLYFIESKRLGSEMGLHLWGLHAKDGLMRWSVPISSGQVPGNVKVHLTERYLCVLNNRYIRSRGWRSSLVLYDKRTGQHLRSQEVKDGQAGREPTKMEIVARNLWLVKDNNIWIFGK